MAAICGLVGSFAAEAAAAQSLDGMLAALRRRAPGEVCSFASPQARLAARYGPGGGGLVATAAQDRYRAVCDGTVFNESSLLEYLRSRGAPPASDDPAGLLLQLFVVDGPGGFKRVDGQFAVAI